MTGARDDHNSLSRLVHRNRRQTLSDLTVEFNGIIPIPISKITVKRKLNVYNVNDV